MTVDGRAIADEIKERLKKEVAERNLSLIVFVMSHDLAVQKFIEIKKKFAESIGVSVVVEELPDNISTEVLLNKVKEAAGEHNGIIVQLPLASHIDTDAVRNAIPVSHDVDVIADVSFAEFQKGTSAILPPVVGAIAEIISRHNISVTGKNVVIVGRGPLVGRSAETWFQRKEARVHVLDKSTTNLEEETRKADILVLGAGLPGLITPEFVKSGAVIFDAGTSESGGKLTGDALPTCASKASLYTPVPGGIGPITVAMIFKNLLTLSQSQV